MNPSRQSSIESNLNNGKGNPTSIFLNRNVKNSSKTMVSDDENDEGLVCLVFPNFRLIPACERCFFQTF